MILLKKASKTNYKIGKQIADWLADVEECLADVEECRINASTGDINLYYKRRYFKKVM